MREEINLAATDSFLTKINEFYSLGITNHLIAIDEKINDIRIQGYVTSHQYKTHSKQNQHFIVNNRYIKNKKMDYAFNSAYLNLLPHRSFPAAFLRLELPAHVVNVNIHPMKRDVSFVNEKIVYATLHRVVKHALRQHFLSSNQLATITPLSEAVGVATPAFESKKMESNISTQELPKVSDDRKSVVEELLVFENNSPHPFKADGKTWQENILHLSPARKTSEKVSIEEKMPTLLTKEKEKAAQQDENVNDNPLSPLKILGQVAKSYIVFLLGDALLLCDQHAVHERINFDRLKKKYAEKKLQYQYLLLPVLIEKDEMTVDQLIEHKSELEAMGLFFDRMDKKSIQIEKIPDYIPRSKELYIISVMIDLFLKHHHGDRAVLLEKMLSTVACRMSIMAGDVLSLGQMEDLMRVFYDNDHADTCPHGRALIKKFALDEMNRFFDRACSVRK